MARPEKTNVPVNRSLFQDVYDECCETEAERMVLDVIIADFLSREVFRGEPQTERTVAKITGLSKSGVRVVEARAMAKAKKSLQKMGIKNTDDVIDSGRYRTAVGAGSVDEKEHNKDIEESIDKNIPKNWIAFCKDLRSKIETSVKSLVGKHFTEFKGNASDLVNSILGEIDYLMFDEEDFNESGNLYDSYFHTILNNKTT